jgi:hypothetical protein
MKNTDLRAKARAIFGPAIAEPMPKQPNGAKALQQRANARPIPTYKVGGVVKKPMPTPGESVKSGNRMSKQEGDEMRFMDMLEKKKRPMPSPGESVKSGNRMAREEGAEMKKMKMAVGGKVPAPNMMSVDSGSGKGSPAMSAAQKYQQMYKLKAQEAAMKRAATRPMPAKGSPQPEVAPMPEPVRSTPEAAPMPPKPAGIGAGLSGLGQSTGNTQPSAPSKLANAISALRSGNLGDLGKQPGFVNTMPKATAPSGPPPAGMAPVDPRKAAMMKKGGKVQTSSDTARKLATEMGGMKKGGKTKPKDGLAVMIAIGKPMKPAKKMNGGPMASGSKDMEASKVTRDMAMGGDPMGYMDGGAPMGYAAGGAGKMRKGMMPEKFAQGGAGKVRKGMMTPEGKITNAMNKMRGK